MPLSIMMTTRFKAFMPFILQWECSYPDRKDGEPTDDKDDPGGYTRWGIDQRSHPKINIRKLDYDGAISIYWQEWVMPGVEHHAFKLGESYFNACVNCGQSRADKILRISNNAADYVVNQENFYHNLIKARPELSKFLKGWLNRTNDLKKFLKV